MGRSIRPVHPDGQAAVAVNAGCRPAVTFRLAREDPDGSRAERPTGHRISRRAPMQPPGAAPARRPCRSRQLSVVQVVRSDAFAGVERYMCQVSNGLASRGHRLAVIGGDPAGCTPSSISRSTTARPTTVLQTARALAGRAPRRRRPRPHDGSRGGGLAGPALPAGPDRGHPPLPRRPGHAAPWPGRWPTSWPAPSPATSPSASSWPPASADPTVLLYNAVPDRPQADLRSPSVLMLQRLTEEKRPELGHRIWAASGLGHDRAGGWWSPAPETARAA